MQRVTITPSHRHPLFAPTVTIHLKDGRSVSKEATGREFIWDYAELTRRIRGITPTLPIPEAQYDDLIATVSTLENLPRADRLIGLTVIP